MNFTFSWSDLSALTTTPGTGGVIRTVPEDFVVEELPAYLPSGEGEHVYVKVEKLGHTTVFVVRELARQLGLDERSVGVAGLKDRHALTTQWLSLPSKAESRLERFELEGVRVVEVTRHVNKLGIGHLRGNRFRVRVRGAKGMAGQARETMALLERYGVPNYFGPQRFGLGGLNATEGLRVMRGESRLRDPRLKRFLVASVQSLLFNRFVSLRVTRGLFDRVVIGDMAKKHDTGGVFRVEDAVVESARALRGELSATGTLFGRKVAPLTGVAGELEAEVLRLFELTPEAFRSRRGDRRLVRVFVEDVSVEEAEGGYWVSFSLPKGSFATSVLRELLKTDVDAGEVEDSAEPGE